MGKLGGAFRKKSRRFRYDERIARGRCLRAILCIDGDEPPRCQGDGRMPIRFTYGMNAVLSRHERCMGLEHAKRIRRARRIYCGIRHGERGRGCRRWARCGRERRACCLSGNSRASREQYHPFERSRRNACRSGRFQRRYRCGCVRARPRQLHGRAHLYGHGQRHCFGARGAALWRVDARRRRVARVGRRRARPRARCGRCHAQGSVSRAVRAFRCRNFPPYDRCCGEGGDCVRMGRRPGGEAS